VLPSYSNFTLIAGVIPLVLFLVPLKYIVSALGLPKLAVLIGLRLLLGNTAVVALARLQNSAATTLGSDVGKWLLIITALQFHLPFYLSRTLPNTLATIITTVGLADWIQGKRPYRALILLTCAAIIFRCDAIMLAGLVGLHLLASKKVTLVSGVFTGVVTAAACLAVTVSVDSWFWRRWLWPEGEVLWFNTILNKSSEWGVSPPSWYFTSALPRALHAAYPLAFLGALLDRRVRPILLVALGFVALYSNLGHKEVRFLFPVLPLWNLCAAASMGHLSRNRKVSLLRTMFWLAAVASLIAGAATAGLGLAASSINYPGGVALHKLHQIGAQHAQQAFKRGDNITVHISVLPAMTGVSRFGEAGPPWVYSKDENLVSDGTADVGTALGKAGFDYLLNEKPYIEGYTMVTSVNGFAGWKWYGGSPKAALAGMLQRRQLFPLKIATAPAVYIHKKGKRYVMN
jgi:alpha-1,6-mannosyltransferase